MSADLAQRLRFVLAMSDFNKRQETVNEAADRIDADARTIADLTAERDRLREAALAAPEPPSCTPSTRPSASARTRRKPPPTS